jgi:putative transposase
MAIHGNHYVCDLKVHLVFVVKYRRTLISPSIKKALISSFRRTCKTLNCRLLESNGEEDRIHLLLEYPAPLSISTIVKRLKGASAASVRKYPSIYNHLWMKSFWSNGYYATSCGGASLDVIKAYIENQDQNSSQD